MVTIGDHRRPGHTGNASHDQPAWFIGGLGLHFEQSVVAPQCLSGVEIDAVFGEVAGALEWIELKLRKTSRMVYKLYLLRTWSSVRHASAAVAFYALPGYYKTMDAKRPHSRLTAQGQISVPAVVRKRMGLAPGSILEWADDGEQVIVRRAGTHSTLSVHRALFPSSPKPHTLSELKEGIRGHMKARHARR